MKKIYEEPQVDVERFVFEDICDMSGTDPNIPDNGKEDGSLEGK